VALACNDASLPTDSRNLVHRAATAFLARANATDGVRIHLEKKIPLAAGLGGGSGNAATTLLGLNDLFGNPLGLDTLTEIAASLGSDIPFFLQTGPGLGTGRGEKIQTLAPFAALHGAAIILVHPGFGISTPWAYQNLARFPEALNGIPGRAAKLIQLLNGTDLRAATAGFYNSLEAPALEKYPLLELYQEFFLENGAAGTLMSGSGSTTFAVAESETAAHGIAEKFRGHFGSSAWLAVVKVD
jgi:4-diphosphocytidyl-2-C-methyl-D-erythritol kinase